MALATLAGGPFGGWYYFGPKAEGGVYGGMVRSLSLFPLFFSTPLLSSLSLVGRYTDERNLDCIG